MSDQHIGDCLKWLAEGKTLRRPSWEGKSAVRRSRSDGRLESSSVDGKSWSHVKFLAGIDTAQLFLTDWEVVK